MALFPSLFIYLLIFFLICSVIYLFNQSKYCFSLFKSSFFFFVIGSMLHSLVYILRLECLLGQCVKWPEAKSKFSFYQRSIVKLQPSIYDSLCCQGCGRFLGKWISRTQADSYRLISFFSCLFTSFFLFFLIHLYTSVSFPLFTA